MIISKRLKRSIAFFLALNLIFDAFFPTATLALTSGPSQPEVQSFTPVGTSDMVNLFTGDFNYNIPLLDVEGYPVNLGYNSGISNDQEASWVGLGWNINPGTINRNMRSLPDDFSGDKITKEFNMKANQTFGLTFSPGIELFGKDIKFKSGTSSQSSLSGKINFGIEYNTYNGLGISVGANASLGPSGANKSGFTSSLGLTSGSGKGLGISANVGYQKTTTKEKDKQVIHKRSSASLGLAFNSRTGLDALTFHASVTRSYTNKDKYDALSAISYAVLGYADANGIADASATGKTRSRNGGASIGFSSPCYTPSSQHAMVNVGLAVDFTFGAEGAGSHPKAQLGGYYSGQFIQNKTLDYHAFGYINTPSNAYSQDRDDVLLDFNREKDQSFTLHTPDLPLSNFTYDVFSVSGQGIGGTYRPFRNDIGVLHDPLTKNFPQTNGSVGIELGAGEVAHVGVNVSITETFDKSSNWLSDNNAKNTFAFGNGGADAHYEPVYFKQAGEKTAETDPNFFNDVICGYDPIRIDIQAAGASAVALSQYMVGPDGTIPTAKGVAYNTKSKRTRRNESISTLTAKDATNFALLKQIQNYKKNDFSMFAPVNNAGAISLLPRTDANRAASHISEITALRADGAKYIYGIPAYNYVQKDVTFAIQKINGTSSTVHNADYYTGLIDYSSGDNSLSNSNGLNNYFEKTTLPAYAHAFLLTAVLSADYVDVTGDGPSPDDLGTYTKINYTRAANTSGNEVFKWRNPFSKANYSEGLKNDKGGPIGDDKGTYTYGEKEIWYVHSIESKNYVACFTLSGRYDGYGVTDENPYSGSNPDYSFAVQKLDKIDLYSKQDLLHSANPSPLKTVNFVYENSLCKGETVTNSFNDASQNIHATGQLENNHASSSADWGKLTLKQVYFTYQGSNKGKLSPYTFNYGDNNHDNTQESNFNYNLKSYDRWGNYKPNKISPIYDSYDATSNDISNAEFPYTDQAPGVADSYAAAWNLTSIILPSGGQINVTYEADDYAYVQDQRAAQMFILSGANSSPNSGSMDTKLYDQSYTNRNYLFFPLTTDISAQVSLLQSQGYSQKSALQKLLLTNSDNTSMTYLYFRCFLNVERNSSAYTEKFENIQGYAKVDYSDPCGIDGNYVYVKIKDVEIFDNISLPGQNLNAISMAGINFTRMNLPSIAYGNQQDPSGFSIMDVFDALKSAFVPIIQMFEGGVSNALRLNHASQKFIPQRSFIRLYNPTGAKKGGGSRIKKLSLNDNWSSTNSNYKDAEYGQEYSYKTKDSYGNEISSGVAAYEPIVGGDENPFRQPVFYEEKHILAPDDDYYLEKPFGECFFPSPSVGYSRVQVKNISRQNVSRHATGAVVHQYYTAKDFPTHVTPTQMLPLRHKPNPVFKLLKINVRDFMTTSQGYVIELNDMHGREKAQFVYKEDPNGVSPSGNYYGNNYISGVEYHYKRNGDRLNNKVDVIEKDGSIHNNYVGVDYDMNVDMRQHRTVHAGAALHGNLEAFLVAIIPGLVPTIWPGVTFERTRYRSAVVTKVMNTYGLLEETVAHDLGSSVSTRNKLWDAETGEVLLTQTTNNFDDKIYSLTYPSHWTYDHMGGAYKNIGSSLPASICSSSAVGDYLVKGDEVILNNTTKAWVKSVVSSPSPSVSFIDINGAIITPNAGTFIKVIRSGRRNQQSLPVAKIVSLNNPVSSSGASLNITQNTNVISASAAEFSDSWNTFCECGLKPGAVYNPFIAGTEGNWRPVKSYVYLAGRTQDLKNENTNIRKDGPYTSFSPFWAPNAGSDWLKNSTDLSWQYTTQMTTYSPYGFELENKDALGRYSSAQYGYNNTLPVSVASNANYHQIGFDGFEDYDFRPCQDDHFGFKLGYDIIQNNYVTQAGSVNQKYSHTGRRSIKVAAGDSKMIKKVLDNCSSPTGNNVPDNSSNSSGSSNGSANQAAPRFLPEITCSSPSSSPFATNTGSYNLLFNITAIPALTSVIITQNGNSVPFSVSGSNYAVNAQLALGSNNFVVTATNGNGSRSISVVINYIP